MSDPNSDYRKVTDSNTGEEVPYEKQTPFTCPCGYEGRIADLEIPDDDNEPLACPQCGGHAWEWGVSESEAAEWLNGVDDVKDVVVKKKK